MSINKKLVFWVIFGAVCGLVLSGKSSYGDYKIYFEGAAMGAVIGLIIGTIFNRKRSG